MIAALDLMFLVLCIWWWSLQS